MGEYMGTAVRSLSEDSHNLLCVQVAHVVVMQKLLLLVLLIALAAQAQAFYGLGYGTGYMPVAIGYSYMPYSYGLYSPYMYGHGMYGRFATTELTALLTPSGRRINGGHAVTS